MATFNLGKFKIKTSGDGIAFRFGEGEIHRLGFGRKNAAPDYDEEYMNEEAYSDEEYGSEGDFAPGGYTGRFSQPASDDYDDDFGGYDDRYEDYADDRYDDGYADDDRYYDDNGDYDDRYLDEDADAYGDEGYESESPLMRYVDENDWVTFVLLVLLPPLGIYLLWRRRRFEQTIRWAVSAVSALWFIIALVLIFSLIFSGSGDVTTNPPIEMTTPKPTVEAEATPETGDELAFDLPGDLSALGASAAPDASLQPGQTPDALAIGATATPIAGFNGGTAPVGNMGNTVIMTATGLYYHNNPNCANIEADAATSNVTRDVADQRGKVACPVCYPNQETFYATERGTYYHVDPTCSDMEEAVQITKDAASQQGKKPCPVCIQHIVNSLKNNELKFADAGTTDRSGMTVYATSGGRYFHLDATCGGMKDAAAGTMLKAMLAGKQPCPKCCSGADTMVWCTRGGVSYHNASDCSGMMDAFQVMLAEAKILGKSKCSVCWGNSTVGTIGSGASSGGSSVPTSGGTIYVYGTKNGKYYHTNSSCSGMSGASRYTLKSMIASGRAACPTCCSEADTVVYATANGTYYHSYASCSGMEGAQAGTLSQALASGKSRCSKCWSGSEGTAGKDAVLGETASGSYVYCTQNGTYYHTKSTCSGMSGASKVQISTAVTAGKKACPTCANAANYLIYSTQNGTYYHRTSSCSGMEGASQRTIEQAVVLGQSACPVCITSQLKSSSSSEDGKTAENVSSKKITSSDTYRSGTSGIKVYATSTSKHYHTTSSCSGMTNASKVTLETALNYGKTACSKCASSANTKVYAVKNGKYYHYSKTCAGSGAVSGNRASALAVGLDACPYCVTKTKIKDVVKEYADFIADVDIEDIKKEYGDFVTDEDIKEIIDITMSENLGGNVKVEDIEEYLKVADYKAGTSGIKVYASLSGKYYHSSKDCAGSGASRITLETAMNYGKSPCSSCASSAKKKVYSTGTDQYYHSSRTCAGSSAVSGTFAKALALGKKECPICIGGSEAYEQSDVKYSAPGDTGVYVDVDSEMLYYHKNARCSDAGLHDGTKVMLDFVVSWGYKACPFCAPPTSVE